MYAYICTYTNPHFSPRVQPETHTKRQATQHGYLPSLLGDGDKEIEKKNILYRHTKANEPTKKGPLSFVLSESPFASVSTVSRGHPSLVPSRPTKASLFLLNGEKKGKNKGCLSGCVS
jgi:hypothetical protein